MTNTNIFLVLAHSLPSEFKSLISCHCHTWDVITLTHKIIFHSNLINTTHWTINSISLLHYSLQCSLYTHTVYVMCIPQVWKIILHGPYEAPRFSRASFIEKLLYPHLKQLWITRCRRILYSGLPHGPYNMESCFKQRPTWVSLAFIFVLYWQYAAVSNTNMHELALSESQYFHLA